MKAISSTRARLAVFAGAVLFSLALLCASTAVAQRTAASVAAQSKAIAEGRNHSGYDVSKEVSLQGIVAKFTENATDFPAGAHVIVQSASGQVDVHLGNPRTLKLNNMTIAQGASIRIIGEPVTTSEGTFFLARLVQQGTQIVAVRTQQGFPVPTVPVNKQVAAAVQGGPR